MGTEPATYIGTELGLFQHARNWRRYHARVFKPYVRGNVLDVGCGMGVNADHLWNDGVASYTFLEPDQRLLDQIPQHVHRQVLARHRRINGTTASLSPDSSYDTILYLDVIEHIEDARAELRRAYDLLAADGHLLILVPAFNFLYNPFDKAIGHYRRYDKAILRNELPPELIRCQTHYLDSLGFFASLANKWFLGLSVPTLGQVLFWDRSMVPVSKLIDPLVFRTFGKSLLSISRKPT